MSFPSSSAPIPIPIPVPTLAAYKMRASDSDGASAAIDSTQNHFSRLPDECLAVIFQSLGSGDRKRCSLVCTRWLILEGQSRHRLSLDARVGLLEALPDLFYRFSAISKLTLKCNRNSDSIGDEALEVISQRCPKLTRLKVCARSITDAGIAVFAKNCHTLRKFSCRHCTFGTKGINAILEGCPFLEKLSVKRLRGLDHAADPISAPLATSSLESICLTELHNGHCFGPLITGSPNLRTLKLSRCSGDWDELLEDMVYQVTGLVEVRFEKLQVSDRGLSSLSRCTGLEILHLVKMPGCTDAGLVTVAERCCLLRDIHIDGWKANRIGDEGLMAVARSCPILQELVLTGLNLTARSLGLIASDCRNLERLALCGSETIGDLEISCIASKCVTLKNLCIKECAVSDHGIYALARGCPNLVKVKVRKCKEVTLETAHWLRAKKGLLGVNLERSGNRIDQLDASISGYVMLESGAEEMVQPVDQISAADLPSSSNGLPAVSNPRLVIFNGMNVVVSTLRSWWHGNGILHQQRWEPN